MSIIGIIYGAYHSDALAGFSFLVAFGLSIALIVLIISARKIKRIQQTHLPLQDKNRSKGEPIRATPNKDLPTPSKPTLHPIPTQIENLAAAMKSALEAKGSEYILSRNFVNYLSDINAFKELPYAKNILTILFNEGYTRKILSTKGERSTIDACINAVSTRYMIQNQAIKNILYCILYALGYSVTHVQSSGLH